MNTVFDNIADSLGIKKNNNSSLSSIDYQNMNNVLENFKNFLSVRKIRQVFMTDKTFSFEFVTKDAVRKEIMNLGSKSTLNGDISVNILKSTFDIHLSYIANIINLSIEEGHFPDELKLTEVFKKEGDTDKGSCRPDSAYLIKQNT